MEARRTHTAAFRTHGLGVLLLMLSSTLFVTGTEGEQAQAPQPQPAELSNPAYSVYPFGDEKKLAGFPEVAAYAISPIWGVDQAVLAVDAMPEVTRLAGIDSAWLQGAVSEYLEIQGIEMLALDAMSTIPGQTVINLKLNANTIAGSGRVGYNVALGVQQTVVPTASPDVVTHATIWNTTNLGMAQGDPEFVGASVCEGVTACLDELVRDIAVMKGRRPATGK